MQFLILVFALLGVQFASAETFTCGFTEPFVTLTYSTASQRLVRTDDATKDAKIYRHVGFEIQGPGLFVLKTADGKEVLRLTLDGKGSDGMSDTVYPYNASTILIGGASGGVGGCSSSSLKAIPGQD